jgi:hypothetical protein
VSAFAELVFERAARAIASIEEPAGIYALSMFVYDTEDDPRFPTVTIGFNTVEAWNAAAAGASDPVEAKWNYAFWLHNALAVIPDDASAADVEGAAARRAWLDENDLWVDDASVETDDPEVDEALDTITRRFVELCVGVSRRLHAEGIIVARFGTPVPVLVHELEYYDQIALQTRDANPPGLADDFVQWVLELG